MRIYLDTSIPSTYFDDRTPDRQKTTQEFWEKASSQEDLLVSDLVLAELEQTRSENKRNQMRGLVEPLVRLKVLPETLRLARILHQAQLVPANKFDDAIHLALAAVEGVDAVVSWNFRQFQIIAPYEYT